jgi:class 3 adenylate cyclase/tetratricopeptide (TPR) repeat protein
MAQPPTVPGDDEATAVEQAVAALEAQRGALGDVVVDAAVGPLQRRLDELRSGAEQRRLVTVVFADVVDFTVLTERLDPEDLRVVMDRYFARWSRIVQHHGGSIEKFIGDAVMAVFGLRRSFEDDAMRAVRASLAVLADLTDLNVGLDRELGVRLAARVGIDTGEVVVSTMGDRGGAEFVAVGPTVNRASRLQTAAPVDGVLISADTHRHVRGAFAVEERPGLVLKGVDGPVDAFVVRHEMASGFRIERPVPVAGVVTTTVGREQHVRALQQLLAEAGEERTLRVVTVVGEAGVGKSRLLLDFDSWLLERPEAVWWFRGRASPTTRGTVGALLRDVLMARLDLRLDDPRETVRARFAEAFTAALGTTRGRRAAHDVAAWLGFDDTAPDAPSDPQALRDAGTEALAAYLAALSETVPVVLLLEDLHWSDDETLRWLDAAAPLLQDRPVLVVASARPAFLESRPLWGEGLEHHVRLDLPALTRRESRALVRQLLASVEDAPAALVTLLLDAGEGNPYYLEELVGWLVDVGVVVKDAPRWRVDTERVGAIAVPPTLRGVLQSRLDALRGTERGALHRAAVIGRVFWDTAVERLDDGAAGVAEVLDGLRGRDVVQQREASRFTGAREFVFKHALLRDVAYDAVLRRQRERYHAAAAAWMEETSARAGRADEYAAVVAGHLEQAGDARAAGWYLRAARRAAAVYALQEATELLDRADRTVAADDVVLRFDIGLAREALLDRAADRDGQDLLLDALAGLEPQVDVVRRVLASLARSRSRFVRSDYDRALAEVAVAERLAVEAGREDLRMEALLLEGKTRTWLEEVATAQRLLDTVIASPDATPAVVAETHRYRSMLAGNISDFGTALEEGRIAREAFRAIGDAEMEAMALAQSATTLYRMNRFADAQAALEESVPILRRAGHRYREVMAMSNLAAVAAQRGNHAVALRSGREAAQAQRDLGDREAYAVTLLTIGESEILTGSPEAARAHLAEALAEARATGNRAIETGALVAAGELELLHGDVRIAAATAEEAAAVASASVSPADRAQALILLGWARLSTHDPAAAHTAFARAEEDLAGLGLAALEREAAAGAASALLWQGDGAAALARIEPVLPHLDAEGMSGVQQQGYVLAAAVDVLAETDDVRVAAVRAQARDLLLATAAEIGDADLAAGYLALRPHAALLADR